METDFVKESKVLLDYIEKLKRGEQVMQAPGAAPPQQTGYGAPAAPRVRLLLHLCYMSYVATVLSVATVLCVICCNCVVSFMPCFRVDVALRMRLHHSEGHHCS